MFVLRAEQDEILLRHCPVEDAAFPLDPTLVQYTGHERSPSEMDKKIDRGLYKDLVRSMEAPTHGIQLLGGKPTANIAIGAEVRQRDDELIE